MYSHYTAALIRSLRRLPVYAGEVYRGERNRRHSDYYKVGQLFSWKQFISASKVRESAASFANATGTLYHIKALGAPDI